MREYIFVDRFAGLNKSARRFSDHDDALRFLRELATDFDALAELRIWASNRGSVPRTDRELLEHAAVCLVSGELVMMAKATQKALATQAPKVRELRERQPRRSTAQVQEEPRESTTPSAIRAPSSAPAPDVAQQVAVLLAAAQSGTPFCEQCEKAKLENTQ